MSSTADREPRTLTVKKKLAAVLVMVASRDVEEKRSALVNVVHMTQLTPTISTKNTILSTKVY